MHCAVEPGAARAIAPDRPLTQSLQRIWQPQQGLPAAPIRSIVQTRDGYLWLGTEKGLFRFDGIRFSPVATTTANGLKLNEIWVSGLCEDSQGNLWIATDGAGLLRLRDGQCERIERGPGVTLESNDVRSLRAIPKTAFGPSWRRAWPGSIRGRA